VDLIGKSGKLAGPNAFLGSIPGFGEVIFHAGPWSPDQEAYDKLKEMVGGEDGVKTLIAAHGANEGEAENLAGNLYYTDTPLTADQMTQLARLVNKHRKADNARSTVDWNAVRKQAGAFLSGPQMAALTQMSERNILRDEEYNM